MKIVAVAVYRDGLILTVPGERRHHDILHHPGYEHRVGDKQGFLLDDGNFLDRDCAYKLAKLNGQLKRKITPNGYNGEDLFSEDLW